MTGLDESCPGGLPGCHCCERGEVYRERAEIYRRALVRIAECRGMTLLGGQDQIDKRRAYSEGAHKAFNQCSATAQFALDDVDA